MRRNRRARYALEVARLMKSTQRILEDEAREGRLTITYRAALQIDANYDEAMRRLGKLTP